MALFWLSAADRGHLPALLPAGFAWRQQAQSGAPGSGDFAWLAGSTRVERSYKLVAARGPTETHLAVENSSGGDAADSARVGLRVLPELIEVHVPLTATTGVFYRQDEQSLRIASDPRILARPEESPDPRAVFSLLQFGALVPPLTMWAGIRQFVPGHVYRMDVAAGTVSATPLPRLSREPASDQDTTPESRQQSLQHEFDRSLRLLCPDQRPVILFSGGVDSSLIAARAAVLGWRDAVLVNYAFGSGDDESQLAGKIAAHLGLPFVRLDDVAADLSLPELFAPHPQPFADHSAIPTSALARQVIARFSDRQTVFDGTGADGAFGLFGKAAALRKLYRIPHFIRSVAGGVYSAGFYLKQGRLEQRLRLARRSAQYSPFAMTVAQNPLCGIAYDAAPADRQAVTDMLDSWINQCMPEEPSARAAAVDICLVCCAIFAQKAKPLYDRSPLSIAFPFLEPPLQRLALTRAAFWPESNQTKAVMKTLLARQIPAEMVYRAKSGFVAPLQQLFRRDAIVAAFEESFGPRGIAGAAFNQKICRQLLAAIRTGAALPSQTYSFIWAAISLDQWWKARLISGDLTGNPVSSSASGGIHG